MAQYTQPSNNDTIYNSSDFVNPNATASLNANNSFSGSLNTFPNASIANLTAGQLNVTGPATLNGGINLSSNMAVNNPVSTIVPAPLQYVTPAQFAWLAGISGMTVGSSFVTLSYGNTIFTYGVQVGNSFYTNGGSVIIGNSYTQTLPITIGGSGAGSTGAINIGAGSGATGTLQIGSVTSGQINIQSSLPITTNSLASSGVITSGYGCQINTGGNPTQNFTVGTSGVNQTPSYLYGLVTCYNGLTVPSGQALTIPTQLPTNNSTLAASTAYVTTAVANTAANMAMTNGTQTFSGANTFSGATTMITQTAGNSTTLAATTGFVTSAITTASTNMAMTNAIQSFSAANTFTGGLTSTALLTASLGLSASGGPITFGTNLGLITTASTPTVSQLGFLIIGALASSTALTSGTIFNASSVAIPAYGTWLVTINLLLYAVTTTQTVTGFVGGYSLVNGTSIPVIGQSISFYSSQAIPATGFVTQNASFIFVSSTATTLYLNMTATFTGAGGTLNCYGTNFTFIKAVRIA